MSLDFRFRYFYLQAILLYKNNPQLIISVTYNCYKLKVSPADILLVLAAVLIPMCLMVSIIYEILKTSSTAHTINSQRSKRGIEFISGFAKVSLIIPNKLPL